MRVGSEAENLYLNSSKMKWILFKWVKLIRRMKITCFIILLGIVHMKNISAFFFLHMSWFLYCLYVCLTMTVKASTYHIPITPEIFCIYIKFHLVTV